MILTSLRCRLVASVGLNPGPNRVALCWLDIILLVLVVGCGLLVWSVAGRITTLIHQYDKPVKERFERDSNLPLRRAAQLMAQKELDNVRAKLIEAQMDRVRLGASIEAIAKNPPQKKAKKRDSPDPERLQRIGFDTATAMAQALEPTVEGKTRSLIEASRATFEAEHESRIAYLKALRCYEFRNKVEKIGIGSIGWIITLTLAWSVCGMARKRWMCGHRAFVLGTSLVIFVALCLYDLLK
jgi:hypothetical protein